MANAFYSPGSQRAARVSALFAAIATRYDLLNDIQSLGLHRLWKRRLVRLAAVAPGDPVLDICCGTGDIALKLARAGADATGLDFSEPMLAVARKRAARLAQPGAGLRFVAGDALQLPFPDDSFAAVTVGYGLRNLSDWTAGLREMVRVAQPGGRVLVLDFGKPSNRVLRGLYFTYLRVMVPLFGLLFCGNAAAYAYILESLRHYPGQDGVAEEMRQLGLLDVRVFNLLGGMMSINAGIKPVLPTSGTVPQSSRVDFRNKLVSVQELPAWRKKVRESGRRLVVTNGCFDLLHLGHVTYLEAARKEGDLLLVGVNADAAVRDLKGPNRPVNSEQDRALVLAALESVGAVTIFPERDAARFLSLAQPDVYVKGGDYTLDTLNQDERKVVEHAGGVIRLLPLVEGRSTTNTLKKLGRE